MGNNVTLIPKKPERHSLLTSTEDVVYMPLGSKDSHGILQVGDNLVVDKGIVSLDLNGDWYQKVLEALELSKSEILILDADGVQTSSGVEFTIKKYEDFEKYKTDKRRFLIKMKLPVLNNIDKDNRVYIRFGSNRYLVFSFVKGMNSQLTLKDLQAVVRKDTDGYSYFANFIYFDSSEFNGFVLDPAASAGTVTGLKPDGVTIGINKHGDLNAIALDDGFINIADELNFDDFKGFVHLTHDQFENIKTYGEIEIDGKVLKYDDSLVYITPDVIVPSNPNLLINGNFELNQRGKEVYDAAGYCVDGWYLTAGVAHDDLQVNFNAKTKTFTVNNISAVNVPNFRLYQYIENSNELLGKTVTVSVNANGHTYLGTGNIAENYSEDSLIANVRLVADYDSTTGFNYYGRLRLSWDNERKMLMFSIGVYARAGFSVSLQLSEAKLEIGSFATPYSPRPLSAEISMSQYAEGGVKNLSNPNLLINGDFKVNQRGQTSYSGTNIYTVDRWRLTGTGVVDVLANGIKYTAGGGWTGIRYFFEKPSQFSNKTITISAKVTGSVGVWCGFLLNGTNVGGDYNEIKTSQIFKATLTFGEMSDNDTLFVRFTTRAAGDTLEFEWVKVEIGSVATEFSPRPYAEELAMCQRYYLPLMNGASVYNGFIFTETNARISVPVPTTMRLRTPTAELKVDDITQCKIYSNGTQVTPTALVYAGFVDSDQFVINATIPNVTPNHTCAMRLLGSASLDAEIY